MMNFDAFEQAVQMVKSHGLPVGVHFNLTEGHPVCEATDVASLVDSRGKFFRKTTFILNLMQGRISEQDVRTELYAQMHRCLDAGLRPDHFDSHHHIHILPMVSRVCGECAEEFGITRTRHVSPPVRGQSLLSMSQQWLTFLAETKLALPAGGSTFWGFELMNRPNKRSVLRQTLQSLRPGVHELMCHPGFHSEENIGLYNLERFDELQALCHESIAEQVKEQRIQLLSFKELNNSHAE